jgi:HlyD family secretion protein
MEESVKKGIFRQSALERLSDPEQLDRLMLVTSPRGWLSLAAVCLVMATALGWSVFGRVPITVSGQGILLESGVPTLAEPSSLERMQEPTLLAMAFVHHQGKRVRPGMTALISPSTVRREEHGLMTGEVRGVSAQPATVESMMQVLGNDLLVQQFSRPGPPFIVEVTLHRDESTFSGFHWTSTAGPPMSIEGGTPCEVQVILEERRPISLVLPLVRSLFGLPA